MKQPDLFEEAQKRRDAGIAKSANTADSAYAEWLEVAVLAIERYAEGNETFMTEDVRDHIVVPAPPDGRAWGAAIMQAAKREIISKAGYSPAKSSNCSPKVLWKSNIYRRGVA